MKKGQIIEGTVFWFAL